MKQNFMLKETWEKLLNDVEALKKKLEKDISKDISIGYDTGGGWHDNALYESALTDQVVIASQLIEISNLLRYPVFIDDKLDIPGDIVTIGVKVTLKKRKEGKEEMVSFKILGPADTRYNEDCITLTSPLGKFLIFHKVGDVIICEMPEGKVGYQILSIDKLFPEKSGEA